MTGPAPDAPQSADPLERYVDGLLEGEALARFEARLAEDPALRAEVELQRRVDEALVRRHQGEALEAPDPGQLLERAREQAAAQPAGVVLRPSWGRRLLVYAAAAAVLALAGPIAWRTAFPPPPDLDPMAYDYGRSGPPRPLHLLYAVRVRDGFTPDWKCEDDVQFADTFRKEVGQAIVLGPPAAGAAGPAIEAVGLAYVHALSRSTTVVLARVGSEEVMVFVDRLAADTQLEPPAGSLLNFHRRELGELVLYEVSPLPEAHLLELFREP